MTPVSITSVIWIVYEKEKQEMTDKERACSFTGHRPERLAIPEERVREWLNEQIKDYTKGFVMELPRAKHT